MHDLAFDLSNGRRSNVNIPFENPSSCMSSHSLSIIPSIVVIVCEIITYELPKYCRLQYLTLKKKFKVTRNNLADYTLDVKLIYLQFNEKCSSISNRFCVVHQWLYSPTLYRLTMLKTGKFSFFTLKMSTKVTNLECQNNKFKQWLPKRKSNPLRASIWRPMWAAALAEKEHIQKDTLYDLNALGCVAYYSRATAGLWWWT